MKTTPEHRRAERRKAENRGRIAETITAWRYRLMGYRLLKQRYRCPSGEIDLIMARGGSLVFIEVKYAGRSEEFSLEKTLPQPNQQKRIIAAADYFLMKSGINADQTRIDVVVVRPILSLTIFRDAIR